MSLHTWSAWEAKLKDFLSQPNLLAKLNEYKELNAHEDEKGRITYTKLVNKQSFGVFSDIVTGIVPREVIHKLPSLAVLLKKRAWIYPKYYVQFAGMEEEDYEYQDMDEIDPVIHVLEDAPLNKPLIGICILDNEAPGLFHGIAFIAWRTDNKAYTFCFYDPLAYLRFKKREDGTTYASNYDYARLTFQSQRFPQHNIKFVDLSQFCLHKGQKDEYHCPQYVMDAEYCYINSAYFLFKWTQMGSSIDLSNIRLVVEACYIVNPDALTRSNTRESMMYRLVMMSFVLSSLIIYLKNLSPTRAKLIHSEKQIRYWIRDLYFYCQEWERKYGFTIIHPSLYKNKTLQSKVKKNSSDTIAI